MLPRHLIDREIRFGAQNYAPLPVVLSHGRGAHLFDVEGRRYIDMMSAYSAASFGHLHPRLVAAMQRQLERLDIVSRAFHSDNLGAFYEDLARITGLDACLVMNSGAEAVETAIKAARRFGYDELAIPADKAEIIVAAGNFHGRTTTIIGFSDDPRIPARLWTLRARLRRRALRRRRSDRGVDRSPHGGRPRRADSGRSRRHRSAERLSRQSAAHLRPARDPPDLRRGAIRLWPHRAQFLLRA